MKSHLSILFTTVVLVAAQSSLASTEGSDSQENVFDARISETKERLGITDEQDVLFSSVLDQFTEERLTLLAKYGLNEENATISFRNLRALRIEIRELNGVARDNLSEILTDEQLKVWDVIQEENREEFRDKSNSN